MTSAIAFVVVAAAEMITKSAKVVVGHSWNYYYFSEIYSILEYFHQQKACLYVLLKQLLGIHFNYC